jgi:CheY-like chemotaxis protein
VVADKTVVLIVEDDQNVVDLVRSNLSARGHDVIVSKDGAGVSGCWKPGRSTWCCWI